MPEVSFIMNTNRNFAEYGAKVVESILNLQDRFEYEILVYSKENPNHPAVTWIPEEKETGGSVYGYNLLSTLAKGDYIIVVVDDYTLSPNYYNMVRHLQSDFFDNKEYVISTPGITVLGSGNIGDENIVPGNNSYTKEILNVDTNTHILKFPAFRRDILPKIDNCLFHPDLIHHWGDNYLSFHINSQGESVRQFNGVLVNCFGYMNGCPKWDIHDGNVVWYLIKNYTGKHVGFKTGLLDPIELSEKYKELMTKG